MPTENEVEVTLCLTDGTKLTRIENIADITTFLEQHEEYVKIVRCKDCLYYEPEVDDPHKSNCQRLWGGMIDCKADSYCSDGLRKDGRENG